jgi:NADH-quinone oxidoreductase subunit G
MGELGPWDGDRIAAPHVPAGTAAPRVPAGESAAPSGADSDTTGAPYQSGSFVAGRPAPSTVAPAASPSGPAGGTASPSASVDAPASPASPAAARAASEDTRPTVDAVLATWKSLIDDGRMLDGEEYLKATGRRAVALVSRGMLKWLDLGEGGLVSLSGERGSVEMPVGVADLPDGVVWAPSSSDGVVVSRDLGAAGSVVRLEGVDQ